MSTSTNPSVIKIRNARQHNLKNIDLDIRTNELTVVTGPSGSGKSSLVFDTLFAEGQRRYVETFSAYARQFLDRMDKPAVDAVEGVPPAIAIDQTNPVRNSRSTVGTMTELNDHFKLLFARTAQLFDGTTALPVQEDTAETMYQKLRTRAEAAGDPRLVCTFAVEMPPTVTDAEVQQWLSASGFTKVHGRRTLQRVGAAVKRKKGQRGRLPKPPVHEYVELDVVADRLRMSKAEKIRVIEAIELCLQHGNGHMTVYAEEEVWKFSSGLHCPESHRQYSRPTPSHFSFNSPVGACPVCKGFGRVIGVDWGLVIPNDRLSLRNGAVKVLQTPAWSDVHRLMLHCAGQEGIPRDTAWRQLGAEQQAWVLNGSPEWTGDWDRQWAGLVRFFAYLESKAYKMHIRVLLSKYRSYTACPACGGARLRANSLLWRVGSKALADSVMPPMQRNMPVGDADCVVQWTRQQLEDLPGLSLHDVMQLPLHRLRAFCEGLAGEIRALVQDAEQKATVMLMGEITTRLKYLCDVGIGYLNMSRQSRTLSGGEVQRINLTTALGTSLVNTLFVLDEPSIGLHPRDMQRINEAMLRLRDAGNTLVVVEHDPAVMLVADRIIEMGPAPGKAGGQVVFDGTLAALRGADTLTGQYLGGSKRIGMGAKRAVGASTPKLVLEGASEHNLQGVDVAFPLGRLVCVTGVSGSGKSTLVQDVLVPAVQRELGQKIEQTPGRHRRVLGADYLASVVAVDQSPIGRTARSNPASYVGAWNSIRDLFAAVPEAKARGYKPAMFSFNSGDGRCPTCGGSGFEHVEMQFLSDVYLRCPDCDGKRYREEVLEIQLQKANRSLSVADVLELTIAEALQVFADNVDVVRALQPIVDVGLDYLTLGQPVPTLSGGEAQRLKLAGHLAHAAKSKTASRQKVAKKGTLFVFDEPTTGLHFDDIAKLMRALRKLLDAGNSLIVVEHNLDVIRAADWLIDLGPEGGEDGGTVVAQGVPEHIARDQDTHTAQALREYSGVFYDELLDSNNYEVSVGEAESGEDVTVTNPSFPRCETAIAPVKAGGESTLEPPQRQLNSVHSLEVREASATYTASFPRRRASTPAHNECTKTNAIQVINAKERNLKSMDVAIPRGQFNVITGVSGSGKSTLAFGIVFNEGQRRYLESLNAYARSMVQPAGRPEVDAVYGIPPTVAIEQRLSRGGRKSTVGTATEVWHFLRLLYVKLGVQHCVHDGAAVQPQTSAQIVAQLMREHKNGHKGGHIGLLAPLVTDRKGVYTDLAKWAHNKGYSHLYVDGAFLPTDDFPRIDRFKEHNIALPIADVVVDVKTEAALRQHVQMALDIGKGVMQVLYPLDGLEQELADGAAAERELQTYSTERACPVCHTSYPELDPRLFSYNSKHGWCPDCVGTGVQLSGSQRDALDDTIVGEDNKASKANKGKKGRKQTTRKNARTGQTQGFAEASIELEHEVVCSSCNGTRLNPQARAVRFVGMGIADLARMSVEQLQEWIVALQIEQGEHALDERQQHIARDVLPEIASRLAFLKQVGLGYLTLDRGAPTLSGGEAQRIRLAAQLGSSLQGVCYVLDEPTIGLHARDNAMLLQALHHLGDKGNTLLVVEHDRDTILSADHIIDIGPGAGVRGGAVVAQGTVQQVQADAASLTGKYLGHAMQHPSRPRRAVMQGGMSSPRRRGTTPRKTEKQTNPYTPENLPWLQLKNARLHNINGMDAGVPLHRLVAVTGVSGSGKSTFARDILLTNVYAATQLKRDQKPRWVHCDSINGWQQVDRVLEVDQTPIGKTPRSCPATYIGFYDDIRKLFAGTLEAKSRGYTASRFSFNTADGRCEACGGQGMRTIEMNFLPDVKVPCEVCNGMRFAPETLAVHWRGLSIGQVLNLSVDDAVECFASMPKIAHPLKLLQDVGLGYLTLGQPSPTLSGGEAQRLKLVTELSKVRDDMTRRGQKAPHTLYVLDEPTVGLHMADVEKLIQVLHRLVDGGHSVIVIEHDLDVIAEADWVIDIGAEGGDGGGKIVAAGTPEDVVQAGTHTGMALGRLM